MGRGRDVRLGARPDRQVSEQASLSPRAGLRDIRRIAQHSTSRSAGDGEAAAAQSLTVLLSPAGDSRPAPGYELTGVGRRSMALS
jgi:hypothetical protein